MARPRKFDETQVLESAMDVFWRKGYAATTPQDLVDELGLGKGSLYNAFGGKRALFERALGRYADTQAVRLTDLLDAEGPVKARIRDALHLLLELDFTDPDRRGCMAVNTATELASSDPEAAEAVRRMFARTEAAFVAALQEAQRAGEIDPARDVRALASLLLATVIGMRVLAKTADGRAQVERVVDGLLDTL
ncbi:TetR/AcrR family transcriptional regulator [Streptomyces sp. NPDC050095]|uniref:TetR/AcrR family transcriptional regulator n=1 Tax=unclassified Streptomyces TaxID=2593676 RepID=UPI003423A275